MTLLKSKPVILETNAPFMLEIFYRGSIWKAINNYLSIIYALAIHRFPIQEFENDVVYL